MSAANIPITIDHLKTNKMKLLTDALLSFILKVTQFLNNKHKKILLHL